MSWMDSLAKGSGDIINGVNRKASELGLNSQLADLRKDRVEALAALGAAVLNSEGEDEAFTSKYAANIRAVRDVDAQIASLQSQLGNLKKERTGITSAAEMEPQCTCPTCGNPVTLDMRFCQMCGDNLASLKERYKVCPSCGFYYPAGSNFCERCGHATVQLAVAQQPPSASAEAQSSGQSS